MLYTYTHIYIYINRCISCSLEQQNTLFSKQVGSTCTRFVTFASSHVAFAPGSSWPHSEFPAARHGEALASAPFRGGLCGFLLAGVEVGCIWPGFPKETWDKSPLGEPSAPDVLCPLDSWTRLDTSDFDGSTRLGGQQPFDLQSPTLRSTSLCIMLVVLFTRKFTLHPTGFPSPEVFSFCMVAQKLGHAQHICLCIEMPQILALL